VKITKDDAFELMRDGRRHLAQMHTRHGVKWFVIPGGEVSDDVAQSLLARPDIQPSEDGLFPGISQTFQFRSQQHPRLRLVTDAMRADAHRRK
jgi:hypothetical protein